MNHELKPEELMLVNQEVAMRRKDKKMVLLLWFFTSTIAGHRFYLGNYGYAVLMILFGWCTLFTWNLADIFFALKQIEKDEQRIRRQVTEEIKHMRGGHENISLHNDEKGTGE